MTMAQILAIIIFVLMFGMIVWDKFEKQYVTLIAAAATMVLVFGLAMHSLSAVWETLNVRSIFAAEFWYNGGEAGEVSTGINWATIIFLFGMMVMVEGMAEAGFFRWLCMRLAKLVHYRTLSLFVVFMIMSTILSMFIDSITVILFLAAVTAELAHILKFDPVPMILSEIFCANLGGSATMCGDPPNIIIGTELGYSFTDFLTNTGVLAGVSLISVVAYFYLVFRRQLAGSNAGVDLTQLPAPESVISSKKEFAVSTVIFAIAVVMLVSHATTGLTVAFIGAFIAVVTLAANARHAGRLLAKVDFKMLLFFVGLFVVVGGLDQTGVLGLAAKLIGRLSHGNFMLMVAIIMWVSAFASAFVDNIPFAATMVPVIQSLSVTLGVDLNTLAWALSMGTDIGGAATPIGASANVVGVSVAQKNGHRIGWGRYCKVSVPATLIVVTISMLFIFWRYC
ncbi:MAG: citrate transporter [Agathobacter sp.]|nr:citrate transporter [Agathobacter sp.]